MAGHGPAPAPTRRRRNKPARGEWVPAPGAGWQYGAIPEPPDGLMAETANVWRSWFGSWWAANWTPEYLSQIVVTIRLYDSVARGTLKDATELRQAMDGIGATFKGQQDRRWAQPKAEPVVVTGTRSSLYGHLRAVGDE